METRKIRRRTRKIKQKGEEISLVDTASVVTTPESGPEVINIRPDGSLDIDEARRIFPEELNKASERAARRSGSRRRRERKQTENKIKKGGS